MKSDAFYGLHRSLVSSAEPGGITPLLNRVLLGLCISLSMPFVGVAGAPVAFPVVREHFADSSWSLTIVSDRFSDSRRCALRSRGKQIKYIGNALVFRLQSAASASNAFFRVDGGEAQSVRDQLPELARLGVAVERTDLDKFGRSQVFLPAVRLADARHVRISPKFGARPRTFNMTGFQSLHARAIALGCTPGGWATK